MTQKKDDAWSADREFLRIMTVAAVTLGVGLLGSILAVVPSPFLCSVGIVLVTIVAGGMGGAAIGFLFGIPRVLTDASPAYAPPEIVQPTDSSTAAARPDAGDNVEDETPTAPKRLLASNSNLEQVSDWLTKIILGLGLTQFYRLNDLLLDFRNLIRDFVPPADQITPLIATIMLVFAVIAGFLAMYLETRLVLSRIFNTVEGILANVLRQKQRISEEKDRAEALASKFEDVVVNMAGDPASSPRAFAAAADSLKSVAQSDQVGPGIRSIAAQALAASGRTREANELIPSGDMATIRDRLATMQVALYSPPPEGFEAVLRLAADLSVMDGARQNGDYWFYQAAAFGQQHFYLRTHDGTPEALASARDNALDCVRRCLDVDANYHIRLYWLLHPEKSPTPSDNDLADFAGDSEFEALLNPPASSDSAAPNADAP